MSKDWEVHFAIKVGNMVRVQADTSIEATKIARELLESHPDLLTNLILEGLSFTNTDDIIIENVFEE